MTARRPVISVRPLTSNDWPVIVRLFGDKGACGGCWCMWWRVPMGGKTWQIAKGDKNRNAFRRLVRTGKVHGVLAFVGQEPVGWCCFGPRNTFPRIKRVRALQREETDGVWSVVCFYIPTKWRGRGVATRLVEAATARAFALGAREVEGFPIVPKKSDEKVPAVFAWTGVPAIFEADGYEKLTDHQATRPIFVRLNRKRPAPST
jgi:GNAT superfamily N-acetyltransferase